MKINLGVAKNRNILVPKSAEPVKGVVVNSIFSTIGNSIVGKKCLDLFAGSGTLGLTALSLKANFCQFIESDKEAFDYIISNINSCKFQDNASCERSDAIKFLENSTETFDYIFLDPPYNLPITHVLKIVSLAIKKSGTLIFLHDSKKDFELEKLSLIKSRTFGKTTISYYSLDKLPN